MLYLYKIQGFLIMQKIELSIESSLKNVALIGVAVNKICSKIKLDNRTCYQIEFCVVEAVNNCIMHAYQNKAGRYIKIVIEFEKENISFKVCDTGKIMNPFKDTKSELSFDPNKPDPNKPDPNILDSLPESGMGVYIINNIMDKVTYKCFDGTNILTMTKYIKDLQLPEYQNPPF